MEMAKRQPEGLRKLILPHEIIRSKRKTLSIAIDPFGRLIVRAPIQCAQSRIEAFLKEKEAWILRKQSERQAVGVQKAPEDLNGYELFIVGKKYRIVYVEENAIRIDFEKGLLYLPKSNAKKRLLVWLKENALRILTKSAEMQAERMGVTFKRVEINSARRSWGLCTGENVLRFSFRLLFAPKEVVEYVVIHELAHVRHKNHSARFWSEVQKYEPRYKERRAWLKKYAALMEIF